MAGQLYDFLYPNAVAIIGASKDPTKRGSRAIQTLLAEKFPGMIFPINPKEKEGPIKYALFCFTLAIGIIARNPEVRGRTLEFEQRRGAWGVSGSCPRADNRETRANR